jgi:hypothetical protein
MNRIIAWCVGSLPFDARSRSAIDETLADWTHETALVSNSSRWGCWACP